MVELREPLEELIHFPRQFTAGTTFPRANEIRLYDTSLRDGEQTPGVAFAPEQKFELACMLSDAGVHMLDVGFPSAAPSERRSLELILDAKKSGRIKSEIVVMCRSSAKDIDVTLNFLAGIGAKPHDASFFVFTSGSDLHLKYKIGRTLLALEGRKPEEWLDLPVSFYREANIKMSTRAIEHARSRGVEGRAVRLSGHGRLLRSRGS
jgi:HMGL-like